MIKVGKGLVKNNIGGACNERYMDPIMKLIIIYIRRKKEKQRIIYTKLYAFRNGFSKQVNQNELKILLLVCEWST